MTIRTLAALVLVALAATPALACEQWDLSGEKTIIQANDIVVIAKLEQTGQTLSGQAHYTARSLPEREGEWPVNGELRGVVEGDIVKFRVSWEADYYSDTSGLSLGDRMTWRSTGIYEGEITADGAVSGQHFDIKDASNRIGWRLLESAQCAGGATESAPAETIAPGMEDNTDRTGYDYRSFFLDKREPELCRSACLNDGDKCKAWTYVRPGVQGEKAVCYLKDKTPATSANTCCISGVPPKKSDAYREDGGFAKDTPDKSSAARESGGFAENITAGMENNTDRPGSDYNRFVLTVADPKNCQTACNADQGCAAWTYVRPGVQQKEAVCYVKRPAPAPVSNTCCISGKKALNPAAVRQQ